MQTPYRKPGKYALTPPDFNMTEGKYRQLQNELKKSLSIRPNLIAEMQKYAADGDFSENAPYQIAKGQLRGLNRRIDEIENILRKGVIIAENKSIAKVALGHFVTLKIGATIKTYQILGSSEADPSQGVISCHSPIGTALMGRSVGDIVSIQTNHKTIDYQIVSISNTPPN